MVSSIISSANPKTYRVSSVDTSVNDVRASADTSAVIIDVVGGGSSLVGDGPEAPRSTGLGDVGVDGEDLLLLNVLDLYTNDSQSLHPLSKRLQFTYLGKLADGIELVI